MNFESSIPGPRSALRKAFLSNGSALLCVCSIFYLTAWIWHLYFDTLALRGFWGDGALEFIIHLSRSYMFNEDSSWVHLFSVGAPRDSALFLNAIGLQIALWLDVHNPQTLKYVFVFWQFALPGFLYILLIIFLWRARLLVWTVFPLLSWAVASVPVDWNAVNSTRWAIPIFWMHFYLVLFAKPKFETKAFVFLCIISALLWGGLYESVVANTAMLFIFGIIIWIREKNGRPLLYTLTALPACIRALLSFFSTGQHVPNGFHGFLLPEIYQLPFGILVLSSFAFPLLILSTPRTCRSFLYGTAALFLIYFALQFISPLGLPYSAQSKWRFDYVALSLILMASAGVYRCLRQSPSSWALPASCFALLVGGLFWIQQTTATQEWQRCMNEYENSKGQQPLLTSPFVGMLLRPSDKLATSSSVPFYSCLWDWTQPWTDLLLAKDGKVEQWPLFSFWQDFSFIEKAGSIFLHTNNWTLTSPSVYESGADLPLKTLLYDLTPLFEKVGLGDLFPRAYCVPAELVPDYWAPHLITLSPGQREEMFVCPDLNN